MADPTLTPGAAGAPGHVEISEGDAWLLDTPVALRPVEAVPLAQAELWVAKSLAILDTTYANGWVHIFDTLDDYNAFYANIAVSGYPNYVNPNAVTRKGRSATNVLFRQQANVYAAYQKYKDAIAFLTGEGLDAFKQRVRDARDTYRTGEALPISATGAYLARFLESATKHVWWLVGNPKLIQFQSPLDYREGKWPPDFPFWGGGPAWDFARHAMYTYVQVVCQFLTDTPLEGGYHQADLFLGSFLAPPYAGPPDSQIRMVVVDGIAHLRTLIALAGV